MLNRRVFLAGAAAAAASSAALYPEFSWNTLPVFTHAGKTEGDFTPEEIRALARFPLITIEKSQARLQGRSCEEGIAVAARAIKAVNPAAKVLFYLNAVIDWPGYAARAEFERHAEWALRDRKGELVLFRERKLFDVSHPGLREWWADTCAKAMAAAPLDGVFMDAVPKIAMVEKANRALYGDGKYEALESGLRELMRLAKQRIGRGRILLYNGLRGDRARWQDGGMRYLEYADAAMIEHFAGISSVAPDGSMRKEWLAADMEMMRKAAEMGKMVLVKGWPAFTLGFPDTSKFPPAGEARIRQAEREIEFPLAAFLAAAGEQSYFLYSWGYRAQDGALVRFPEYEQRLGRPKGAAVREGYRYRREFEHAKVEADLAEGRGRVEWT
jgi:hypothetical protein